MKNLAYKKDLFKFEQHSFHLVNPSPRPIFTSISSQFLVLNKFIRNFSSIKKVDVNKPVVIDPNNLSLNTNISIRVIESLGVIMLLVTGTALGPFCILSRKVDLYEGLGPKGLLRMHSLFYKTSIITEILLTQESMANNHIVVDKSLKKLITDQLDEAISSNIELMEKIFPYYWSGDLSIIRNLYLIGGSTQKVIPTCPYNLSDWTVTQAYLSWVKREDLSSSRFLYLMFSHSLYGTHYRSIKEGTDGNFTIGHGLLLTTVSPNVHVQKTVGEMDEIIYKLTLSFILNKNYKLGKKSMK